MIVPAQQQFAQAARDARARMAAAALANRAHDPQPILTVLPFKTVNVIELPKFLPERDIETKKVIFNPLFAQLEWVKSASALLRAELNRKGLYHPKIPELMAEVSKATGVNRVDMMSARRTACIVFPRQFAMWLCKVTTPHSLPEVGRRFGGRDHTTVLHAVRKIQRFYDAGNLPPDLMAIAKKYAHLIKEPTP